MLKAKLQTFYELIDRARTKVGDSAPRITDEVIQQSFPRTCIEAEMEGCDQMLREGVKNAVAKYIRKPPQDERQRTFADLDPEILPLAKQLPSAAYFVPDDQGGEYVSVPDLCFDIARLDGARAFMRRKGEEVLAEADRLDDLYRALAERSDSK